MKKQRKDREVSNYRSIYKAYIIDDGWNIPKEVIEVIDFKIEQAWDEAYAEVCKQRNKHKGKWITKKDCFMYEAKSWIYRVLNDSQYEGKVREIGLELQRIYGVTEVEAINIMNGKYINEYVEKYYRLKNRIPLKFCTQDICDKILEEYKIKVV